MARRYHDRDEFAAHGAPVAHTAAGRRGRPRDGDGDGFVFDGTPRMRPFNPLTDVVGKAVKPEVIERAARGSRRDQDAIRQRTRANVKVYRKAGQRLDPDRVVESTLDERPTSSDRRLPAWQAAEKVVRNELGRIVGRPRTEGIGGTHDRGMVHRRRREQGLEPLPDAPQADKDAWELRERVRGSLNLPPSRNPNRVYVERLEGAAPSLPEEPPRPRREVRRDVAPAGPGWRDGDMPSDEQLAAAFTVDLGDGYSTEVTYSEGGEVRGIVLADGVEVGTFKRNVRELAPIAEFETLRIREEHAGKGLGHRFFAESVDRLRDLGVERIDVYAHSRHTGDGPNRPGSLQAERTSNGAYTWARMGYDWGPGTSSHTQIARRLDSIVERGLGTPDERRQAAEMAERLRQLDEVPWNPADIPDDFPTPNDVAMLGWTPDADSWMGREVMTGRAFPEENIAWYGAYHLTDRPAADLPPVQPRPDVPEPPPVPDPDMPRGPDLSGMRDATPDQVRDAARAAGGPIMARAADNRRSRSGILRGDAVQVEYVNDDWARVRNVQANGRTRAYRVRWDRFNGIDTTASEPPATYTDSPDDIRAAAKAAGSAMIRARIGDSTLRSVGVRPGDVLDVEYGSDLHARIRVTRRGRVRAYNVPWERLDGIDRTDRPAPVVDTEGQLPFDAPPAAPDLPDAPPVDVTPEPDVPETPNAPELDPTFADIAPDGKLYRAYVTGERDRYSPDGAQGAIYWTGVRSYAENYGDDIDEIDLPPLDDIADVRDPATAQQMIDWSNAKLDELDAQLPDIGEPGYTREGRAAIRDAREAQGLADANDPWSVGRLLATVGGALNQVENPDEPWRSGTGEKRMMDELDWPAIVAVEAVDNRDAPEAFSFAFREMPDVPERAPNVPELDSGDVRGNAQQRRVSAVIADRGLVPLGIRQGDRVDVEYLDDDQARVFARTRSGRVRAYDVSWDRLGGPVQDPEGLDVTPDEPDAPRPPVAPPVDDVPVAPDLPDVPEPEPVPEPEAPTPEPPAPAATSDQLVGKWQLGDWEQSQPWNLSIDDVRSGTVPWLKVGEGRGTELASQSDDGTISVTPAFFDLTPEMRRHALFHESGHRLSDITLGVARDADGNLIPAGDIDAFDAYNNARDTGRWVPSGNTPGEMAAEAYGLLFTDPQWLADHEPEVRDWIIGQADTHGFPVPDEARNVTPRPLKFRAGDRIDSVADVPAGTRVRDAVGDEWVTRADGGVDGVPGGKWDGTSLSAEQMRPDGWSTAEDVFGDADTPDTPEPVADTPEPPAPDTPDPDAPPVVDPPAPTDLEPGSTPDLVRAKARDAGAGQQVRGRVNTDNLEGFGFKRGNNVYVEYVDENTARIGKKKMGKRRDVPWSALTTPKQRERAVQGTIRERAERIAEQQGVPVEVAEQAIRDLPNLRSAVQADVNAAADDALAQLDLAEGAELAPPPKKVWGLLATGGEGWINPAGAEWEWFFDLSPREQARVRRNWLTGTTSPDEFADYAKRALGDDADIESAMAWYMDNTRMVDAAASLRRGKLPAHADKVDLDGVAASLGDEDITVYDLFGRNPDDAAAILASRRHAKDAEEREEWALRQLGDSVRGDSGERPWELGRDEWMEQVSALEYRLDEADVSDAELDRYDFLAPPDLREGGDLDDVYDRIREAARDAGFDVAPDQDPPGYEGPMPDVEPGPELLPPPVDIDAPETPETPALPDGVPVAPPPPMGTTDPPAPKSHKGVVQAAPRLAKSLRSWLGGEGEAFDDVQITDDIETARVIRPGEWSGVDGKPIMLVNPAMADNMVADGGIGLRVLTHEAAHTVSHENPLPGFSHDFEEGGAELLSQMHWAQTYALGDNDMIRVDGQWRGGVVALHGHGVYARQTRDLLGRILAENPDATHDDVKARIIDVLKGDGPDGGVHNYRLAFRDATADAEPATGAQMAWLLGSTDPVADGALLDALYATLQEPDVEPPEPGVETDLPETDLPDVPPDAVLAERAEVLTDRAVMAANLRNESIGGMFAQVSTPRTLSGTKLHVRADNVDETAEALDAVWDVIEGRGLGAKVAGHRFHDAVAESAPQQSGKGLTIYLPERATVDDDTAAVADALRAAGYRPGVSDPIAGDDTIDADIGLYGRYELRDGAPDRDLDVDEYREWYQEAPKPEAPETEGGNPLDRLGPRPDDATSPEFDAWRSQLIEAVNDDDGTWEPELREAVADAMLAQGLATYDADPDGARKLQQSAQAQLSRATEARDRRDRARNLAAAAERDPVNPTSVPGDTQPFPYELDFTPENLAVGETGGGLRTADITPEKLGQMTEAWQQAPEQMRLRAPAEAVVGILADGRVKTMYETGTSRGGLHGDARRDTEKDAMGVPRDLPDADRPVYGYAGDDAGTASTAGYGSIVLHVKPEVAGRTTAMFGDSLGTKGAAVPLAERDVTAERLMAAYEGGWRRDGGFNSGGFTELQFHGGLTVDDLDDTVDFHPQGWDGYQDELPTLGDALDTGPFRSVTFQMPTRDSTLGDDMNVDQVRRHGDYRQTAWAFADAHPDVEVRFPLRDGSGYEVLPPRIDPADRVDATPTPDAPDTPTTPGTPTDRAPGEAPPVVDLPDPGSDADHNGFSLIDSRRLGSNPGAWFTRYEDGPDGRRGVNYYVKRTPSEDHAGNEVAANLLYELAGVQVPEVTRGTDGTRIASRQVGEGLDDLRDRMDDTDIAAAARRDFVVDAWLANWDVAGMGLENIVVDRDGQPWRIDSGGALAYRARGDAKGDAFGPTVGELDTLRDPAMNPAAARVFGDVTDAELRDGAERVAAISDDDIRRVVDAQGLDPSVADTLIARRDDIARRLLDGPDGDGGPDAGPPGPRRDVTRDSATTPDAWPDGAPTPDQLKEAFTADLGDGYSMEADYAAPTGKFVSGPILLNGERVGSFERTIDPDRPIATFDRVQLDEAHQGKGVGSRLFAASVDNLRELGVAEIRTTAVSKAGGDWNGAYTWARAGYDWAPGDSGHQSVATWIETAVANEDIPADLRDEALALADRLGHRYGSRPLATIPADPAELPDDFPTPNDVAMLGWTPGATDWPGKRLLTGGYPRTPDVAWEGVYRLDRSPTTNDDYRGLHRPSYGPGMHEIDNGELLPTDVLQHPEWYTGYTEPEFIQETVDALRRANGDPDATVTVYRAAPPGVDRINNGDWVSLSRKYAEQHGYQQAEDGSDDWPVIEMEVPASDVRFAGDDLMEWGYWPQGDPDAPEPVDTPPPPTSSPGVPAPDDENIWGDDDFVSPDPGPPDVATDAAQAARQRMEARPPVTASAVPDDADAMPYELTPPPLDPLDRPAQPIDTIDDDTLAVYEETWRQAPEQMRVRVPADAIFAVLDEGRIRNQFETRSSKGDYNPDGRRSAEYGVMGVPQDVDDSLRPVYGYVGDDPGDRSVGMYGEVSFRVRPKVAGRTTMTFGDSLGAKNSTSTARAVPLSGEVTAADLVGSRDAWWHRDRGVGDGSGYSELQFHGGLSLADDVEPAIGFHPQRTTRGSLTIGGVDRSTVVVDPKLDYVADAIGYHEGDSPVTRVDYHLPGDEQLIVWGNPDPGPRFKYDQHRDALLVWATEHPDIDVYFPDYDTGEFVPVWDTRPASAPGDGPPVPDVLADGGGDGGAVVAAMPSPLLVLDDLMMPPRRDTPTVGG